MKKAERNWRTVPFKKPCYVVTAVVERNTEVNEASTQVIYMS